MNGTSGPLPPGCLSDSELLRVLDAEGEIEPEVIRHFESCAACRAGLEALAGVDGFSFRNAPEPVPSSLARVMRALAATSHDDAPDPDPPEGAIVLAPSDEPGALGSFAGYDVLALVARGGMGVVYKAWDRALHRVVAIKVLAPALAASPTARMRFLREARAAAAVTHEHVVAIHAVGEHEGLPYLVMQFIHGRSLEDRLNEGGPLTASEVLRIGCQAAYGLAAAHAQGLVHRDIKPGNILLENSVERVRITDFGLARAGDSTDVTAPGVLAGTPQYMAPEQARGERLDHRADLFALGCVLYTAATGDSPFRADSTPATLRRVCEENPPPVREVVPGFPEASSDCIARLMAKNPADRPPDALTVARHLEALLAKLQGSPTATPDPAQPRARSAGKVRHRVAAAALLAVVLLLLTWAGLRRHEGGVTAIRLVRAGETVRSFTRGAEATAELRPGDILEFDWDGARVVAPMRVTNHALHVRAAPGRRPIVIHAALDEPWIMAEADVRIEGLEVIVDPGRAHAPAPAFEDPTALPALPSSRRDVVQRQRTHQPARQILAVRGARLEVIHCRLANTTVSDDIVVPILLIDVPHARIAHSEIIHHEGPAIAWRTSSSSRLVLTNSLIFARSAFFTSAASDARPEFELHRCTIHGSFLIASLANGDRLRGRSFGSVISVRRPIIAPRGAGAPSHESWSGAGNLYSRPGAEFEHQIPPNDQGSMAFNLRLDERLRDRILVAGRLAPADFVLTPAQQARFGRPVGIDPPNVGPSGAGPRDRRPPEEFAREP